MTKEQKEMLRAWCDNLLVTYRIDYFRGNAIKLIVQYAQYRSRWNSGAIWLACREAKNLGFEPDQKDYTELLRELREIAKEVPLSDTAQSAITYVFGGEWEEAMEASTSSRANATNRTNHECALIGSSLPCYTPPWGDQCWAHSNQHNEL